jgi:hypothetical protein
VSRKGIGIRKRIAAWWQGRNRVAAARRQTLLVMVKIGLVAGLLVGAVASLRYAEVYVKATTPPTDAALTLLDVPSWVNWDLRQRVIEAAGGSRLPIKEETAKMVGRNLSRVSWLADVIAHVTNDEILVKARWRKPVALLEKGSDKFYVDKDLYALDYMSSATTDLPIVGVRGVSMSFPPAPGKRIDCNDLAAAVKLIGLLHAMDVRYGNKDPLLERIADVDVSNYKGRKNGHESHIVLNSKDGAVIQWGAELGDWGMYMESNDADKLTKLYVHFHDHGALGSGVKYVDLRNPQDYVPQPIDRYSLENSARAAPNSTYR